MTGGVSRSVPVSLVVARARNGVIGRAGALPWRLRDDMALFRQITLGRPVIMGRKTWDSLPARPLKGRANIVLSRDGSFAPSGAIVCDRFDEALQIGREQAADEVEDSDGEAREPEVCVIGGEALFALALPKAARLHLTEVEADVEGDVVFPPFDEAAWREAERRAFPEGEGNEHPFTYRRLERR